MLSFNRIDSETEEANGARQDRRRQRGDEEDKSAVAEARRKLMVVSGLKVRKIS